MGRHDKSQKKRTRRQRMRSWSTDMVPVTISVPDNRVEAIRRYATRLSRRHPAKRDEVVYLLRKHASELERFGLSSLSLFGSVARDQSTRESDVDLVVEFQPGRPDGLFEFVALKGYLSSILGRPVDLITLSTIKPRLKARILKEAIRVI